MMFLYITATFSYLYYGADCVNQDQPNTPKNTTKSNLIKAKKLNIKESLQERRKGNAEHTSRIVGCS